MTQLNKSSHTTLVEMVELAVQEAGQNVLSPTQQIEKSESKTKEVKSDYEQLKEDHKKLLEKVNSLLLENFELRQKVCN